MKRSEAGRRARRRPHRWKRSARPHSRRSEQRASSNAKLTLTNTQRMSVRKGNANHALPPDAVFIDFPRTDGDSNTWPADTERVVDAEGNVNYFRPYDHNEGTSVNWRKNIGPLVAAKLGLAGELCCHYTALIIRSMVAKTDRRMY